MRRSVRAVRFAGLAALVVLGACSSPGATSQTAPPTTANRSETTNAAFDDLGTVTHRMTWNGGKDVLDPPAHGAHPRVSAAHAYAVGADSAQSWSTTIPASDISASKPTITFGLYSAAHPTSAAPGHEPTYDRRPMWVIWWHHIPSNLPATEPGSDEPLTNLKTEDVMLAVDATDGLEQVLEGFPG